MENIPINKGNYDMDTEDRSYAFFEKLEDGWENEYRKYRSDWVQCAKSHRVLDYPLLVDIETSSLCNLRCPMCYTITEEFKKHAQATLMDIRLYNKIIDEIAGSTPAIRLSLRGEPTLHPELPSMIHYAKEKGVGEVSFLTNGSKLTATYIETLINAGLDWITISIDGMDTVYEYIRRPMKFNDILQSVKEFSAAKERLGVSKPVVKIQSIWPAIRDNPAEFYHCFEPYVDLIAFNPLIDYLSHDDEIQYIDNFSCPQFYQRIIVTADGTALMCSNDEENSYPLGDVNIQSIHEIWHGEKLNEVRALHMRCDGYKELPVCAKCYLPRATSGDETAKIDGRTFLIPNYVGRSQVIGE